MIPDSTHAQQSVRCTPSPINDDKPSRPLLHSSPLSAPHIPASSDTEDDSQGIHKRIDSSPVLIIDLTLAVFLPSNNTPAGRLAFFKVPAPPAPKAGPSQYQTPSKFSGPIFPNPNRAPISQSSHARGALWDPDTLDFNRAMNAHQKSDADKEKSANASKPSDPGLPPATKLRSQTISLSSSVKGKEREVEAPYSTPLTSKNVGQKRLEDYSAFKGRGRYGKADESAQYVRSSISEKIAD
jgi:hypothetical protein